MSKRAECLKFASLNGLQIKADRQRIVVAFCPATNWTDVFEGWNETHAFLVKSVAAHNDSGTQYPWNKERNNSNA